MLTGFYFFVGGSFAAKNVKECHNTLFSITSRINGVQRRMQSEGAMFEMKGAALGKSTCITFIPASHL